MAVNRWEGVYVGPEPRPPFSPAPCTEHDGEDRLCSLPRWHTLIPGYEVHRFSPAPDDP